MVTKMAQKKSKVTFVYKGPSSSKYEPGQTLEVTERFAEPYRQSSIWKEQKTMPKKAKKDKEAK